MRRPRCCAVQSGHVCSHAGFPRNVAEGEHVIASDYSTSPREHHDSSWQSTACHWPEGRFCPLSLPPVCAATSTSATSPRRPATTAGSDRGQLIHGRRRVVPDPAHAAPDLRPGRRRRHSARCPKTAPPEPDLAGTRRRNGPESALVCQRTTQVPNEATLRAASATAAAAQVLVLPRHGSPPQSAPARRQHASRPRCPLPGPARRARDGRKSPSGHRQPSRRRWRRVTRQGRSASGGPAQRVDSVTAVAFPASANRASLPLSMSRNPRQDVFDARRDRYAAQRAAAHQLARVCALAGLLPSGAGEPYTWVRAT